MITHLIRAALQMPTPDLMAWQQVHHQEMNAYASYADSAAHAGDRASSETYEGAADQAALRMAAVSYVLSGRRNGMFPEPGA